MLYYTTYIIINLRKTVIKAKQKKSGIKCNNSLNSIVVRSQSEQHLIQK